MNFEPVGNRIMVALEGAEERTKSGLYIPESAKERPQIAVVLAVGPGRMLPDGTVRPSGIKQGDRIVLGKYAGMSVTLGEKSFTILDADEVLGVLR